MKHEQRGDTVFVVSAYGSAQHRSIAALVKRGLVATAFIQPYELLFVFATREGQRLGIGRHLSLGARERTETKVVLNDSERFHLREALKQYKPYAGSANSSQLVDLSYKLSARGERVLSQHGLEGTEPRPVAKYS